MCFLDVSTFVNAQQQNQLWWRGASNPHLFMLIQPRISLNLTARYGLLIQTARTVTVISGCFLTKANYNFSSICFSPVIQQCTLLVTALLFAITTAYAKLNSQTELHVLQSPK